MRILFDNDVPWPLRKHLTGHEVLGHDAGRRQRRLSSDPPARQFVGQAPHDAAAPRRIGQQEHDPANVLPKVPNTVIVVTTDGDGAFLERYWAAVVREWAFDAVQVLVENSHPKRTLRVWLDRYHMGTGTGDRSRTDLAPGGPPEALGCSRDTVRRHAQAWEIQRRVNERMRAASSR